MRVVVVYPTRHTWIFVQASRVNPYLRKKIVRGRVVLPGDFVLKGVYHGIVFCD